MLIGAGRYVTGLGQAVQTVYAVSGLRGFAKGMSARVLFATPAGAISWCTYETLKHFLSESGSG